MVKQPIVDSHIHFWNPDHLQYNWLVEVPAINKAFLPSDLAEQAATVNLEKIVLMYLHPTLPRRLWLDAHRCLFKPATPTPTPQ